MYILIDFRKNVCNNVFTSYFLKKRTNDFKNDFFSIIFENILTETCFLMTLFSNKNNFSASIRIASRVNRFECNVRFFEFDVSLSFANTMLKSWNSKNKTFVNFTLKSKRKNTNETTLIASILRWFEKNVFFLIFNKCCSSLNCTRIAFILIEKIDWLNSKRNDTNETTLIVSFLHWIEYDATLKFVFDFNWSFSKKSVLLYSLLFFFMHMIFFSFQFFFKFFLFRTMMCLIALSFVNLKTVSMWKIFRFFFEMKNDHIRNWCEKWFDVRFQHHEWLCKHHHFFIRCLFWFFSWKID